MANLRIGYNNAAKRLASIAAEGTVSGFSPSAMTTDIKGEVWRGENSVNRTLTFSWAAAETISMAALPFCSASSTFQMRVRCFSDAACTTQIYSTGWQYASPSSIIGSSGDWGTLPFGVNAYSYGGASSAVLYFAPVGGVLGLKIDLNDVGNPLGYIEIGALFVGQYFSPTYNVQAGEVSMEMNDTSKHERSDSGDLYTDRGPMYKTMTLTLQHMPPTDRDYIWRILRGNGMSKPVFISASPESTDTMDEQIFSIYGKLSKGSAIQYQFMGQYQTSLSVEEL